MKDYKELSVWKKAISLVTEVYELTVDFPPEEKFGLIMQMRRAAVSIPSNIAEGSKRGTRKDYAQFIGMALGSAAELETQIEIVKRLSFGRHIDLKMLETSTAELIKMLTVLRNRLRE